MKPYICCLIHQPWSYSLTQSNSSTWDTRRVGSFSHWTVPCWTGHVSWYNRMWLILWPVGNRLQAWRRVVGWTQNVCLYVYVHFGFLKINIEIERVNSRPGSDFYWGNSPVIFRGKNPGGESFPTFPSGGYAHAQEISRTTGRISTQKKNVIRRTVT